MAPPRETHSPRQYWVGLVIASLAVVLIVIAAGLGISMLRQAAVGQSGSQQPEPSSTPRETAQETTQEPLPAPDGTTIIAVLDPAVERPTIGADQAIAIARAAMGSWVGNSPMVQLVQTTARDPESTLSNFTGWVILSTVIPYWYTGPAPDTSAAPFVPAATYTWMWVTSAGQVLDGIQIVYDAPEEVPPLPQG